VKRQDAALTGAGVSAACVACCAPPLIAAFGLAGGMVAVLGVFLGIAGLIAGLLIGGTWLALRYQWGKSRECAPVPVEMVPMADPTVRQRT